MVRFAFKSPYVIIVAALMMVVLGLFAMFRIPLDILPTFKLPAVMVVTTYTGMPAETMEVDITNRLERWLSQAAGLDHMESRSMIGVSILNCFFEPGFDPNNALAQISTLVMSDLHYLPPGTQPPIVIAYDPTANLPVGLMTVFTPGLNEAQLWDESNYIVRNQLNAVPGAVAPVVFGGKFRQIMSYLDPAKLAGYGLSPMDVVNALQKGNAMIPTGDVKIGDTDFSVTTNGMAPNLETFNSLPIKVVGDAPVFLRDVGKTEDSSAVQTNVVQVNGVRETFIPIFRRLGASTLSVVSNIVKSIPSVLNSLPDRTELKLVFDQSPKIRDAIVDVIRELVVGVLLASLVIYLFLGSFEPTIIAALIIPLSIVGGAVAIYYSGNSFNLMTLGGLALITGPLIDKAVVALENIERHMHLGASVREASDRGVSEMQLPVLMASLALIVVFFPVTFFQGLGKFLFTPMAFTVAATEIISYFAVMTIVPLLASRIMKKHDPAAGHGGTGHAGSGGTLALRWKKFIKRLHQGFGHGYAVLQARYERILELALLKPATVVALACIALGVSLFLIPLLGTEFFPTADHGQFFVRMRAESGTRIEKTAGFIESVTQAIRDDLPKDSVGIVLGNTGVIPSWAAAYSPNSASHDSVLEVSLSEDARISGNDAISILRERFAKDFSTIHFSFSLIDPVASALNYGALSPVDLRVLAPSLKQGEAMARDLLAQVNGVRGITDAFVEQQLDYPGIHIDVDRTKAAYLGLTADEVIKNIITALNSSVLFAPNFWDDPVSGNNYFIGAMYPEKDITSMETIENIPMLSSYTPGSSGMGQPGMSGPSLLPTAANRAGRPLSLLRNVATLSPTTLPVEISHFNLKRSFDVMASLDQRDIGSAAGEIDRIVSRLKLPKGYSVQWAGQVQSMRDSFGSMGVGMALSLVLIFLLMVAQLKSFVDPLLILATVPMGFIGVLWMLFLTNTTLNIQSMMGMIMLVGIVVSNTVILTDYANQRLAEGATHRVAIRDAGHTRLRPILMTAISAVMALLPSSLSGANAPLARAVIGGLLSSTFLSLVFLPALYVLVKERGALKIAPSGGSE